MRRIAGQESIATCAGQLERSLEERQGRCSVSARAPKPAALHQHPALRSADLFRHREQSLAFVETTVQTLHACELCQDARSLRLGLLACEQAAEP